MKGVNVPRTRAAGTKMMDVLPKLKSATVAPFPSTPPYVMATTT